MELKEAILQGHELDVYLDSEMADEQTGRFDDLWQSIYDIVQLGCGGIVESDPRELEAAIIWLKATQSLTQDYLTLPVDFEVSL